MDYKEKLEQLIKYVYDESDKLNITDKQRLTEFTSFDHGRRLAFNEMIIKIKEITDFEF